MTAPSKPADVYIIRGNPDVDPGNADKYEAFYQDVAGLVRNHGFTPAFDPGAAYTVPPGGRLWLGHSRGADRLRFAPKGVATLRLDDYEPEEARQRQQRAYDDLLRRYGLQDIAQIPAALRPTPGPEHYTLSDAARQAIADKLQALRRSRTK